MKINILGKCLWVMPFYDGFIQLFYDFVLIVLRHNSARYK